MVPVSDFYGKVVNAKTGEAVPGATVLITDQSGKPTGAGTAAGTDGKFILPNVDLTYKTFAVVSSVNFDPLLIQLDQLAPGTLIALAPKEVILPAVEIVAKKTKPNYLGWILLVALGFLVIQSTQQKN